MRIIHIRFKDRDSLDSRVVKEGRLHKCLLRNSKGQQLILVKPQLRRTLLSGALIVDQWGDSEKWFCDNDSSIGRLW